MNDNPEITLNDYIFEAKKLLTHGIENSKDIDDDVISTIIRYHNMSTSQENLTTEDEEKFWKSYKNALHDHGSSNRKNASIFQQKIQF